MRLTRNKHENTSLTLCVPTPLGRIFMKMEKLSPESYDAVQRKVLTKLLKADETAIGIALQSIPAVREFIRFQELCPAPFEKTKTGAMFEISLLMYMTFANYDEKMAEDFVDDIGVFRDYLNELADADEPMNESIHEPEVTTVSA